ncbi:hypothetical protein C8J57DRAFT_1582126 [Mycena rebaudengoi]|nr:hypothetical protein C8J57DRAFT_1582126 [Mycena rebaudengoi]
MSYIAAAQTAITDDRIIQWREYTEPVPEPIIDLHADIDALYAWQSMSLAQAAARYTLRSARAPPPNYARWYDFAAERRCLIDEYDNVHRDFEPFYQLAHADRGFFRRMVEKAVQMVGFVYCYKYRVSYQGRPRAEGVPGVVCMLDERGSAYNDGWMKTLGELAPLIPDTTLLLNHRDEPRVAFDPSVPARAVPLQHAIHSALNASDDTPFLHSPKPTAKYYKDEGHCVVPNEPKGFTTASADFSTDSYPVLSQAKIRPCFADIMFPSEYHYPRSGSSPKYAFPNNVSWADKKGELYWRGQSVGSWISGTNYRAFPRFRLIDIARKDRRAKGIMDVAITAFHSWFCQVAGCDADAIRAEYDIVPTDAAREAAYGYEYVFDVDGNGFSGWYLARMRSSGGLVFKSTVFNEYFDAWLRPYEHYIPVLPDLSDLVDKVLWARKNEGEERRIQGGEGAVFSSGQVPIVLRKGDGDVVGREERVDLPSIIIAWEEHFVSLAAAGQAFVERVLTDGQNDCYFLLVMLEWARLWAGGDGTEEGGRPVNQAGE